MSDSPPTDTHASELIDGDIRSLPRFDRSGTPIADPIVIDR
jgi:hypothetical protein